MTALWAAIFASSLAGSLHCIAMCGPLIGLHGGARSLRLALVHALGRLTTYAALGALAGLLGRAVDMAGHLAAIQHGAAIAAGALTVGWGLRTIAIARGWLRTEGSAPALFGRGLVQLRARRAVSRAWLVGVLTGLLPCGWLWVFVVSASGTGSPWAGAAVMTVFWLGTVPAMTGLLALGGPVIARIRRKLPVISASLMIALGLVTLATRWRDAGATGETPSHCHR
ncbi:MAG TPA: sulfite exporter TauE/SafE family protein, partial [Kofleriaceae bacterium]